MKWPSPFVVAVLFNDQRVDYCEPVMLRGKSRRMHQLTSYWLYFHLNIYFVCEKENERRRKVCVRGKETVNYDLFLISLSWTQFGHKAAWMLLLSRIGLHSSDECFVAIVCIINPEYLNGYSSNSNDSNSNNNGNIHQLFEVLMQKKTKFMLHNWVAISSEHMLQATHEYNYRATQFEWKKKSKLSSCYTATEYIHVNWFFIQIRLQKMKWHHLIFLTWIDLNKCLYK